MAMDNLSTAELDLPTSEYDIMTDLDGTESRAQVNARESEPSSALSTMTQHPSSLSSGSWQVVNWPKMDPRDLLQSWNWVFQNRHHPQALRPRDWSLPHFTLAKKVLEVGW